MNPPTNDAVVTPAPNDSVSSIKFHPKGNYLLAGSWDNQVRCWEIQSNGATIPKFAYAHDAPVLCCCWSGDGMKCFSGGCEKIAKCYDVNTGQAVTIGTHDAPIKTINYIEQMSLLCTGSWDKTLRYWDGRQPNPVGVVTAAERVYCVDARFPVMVVATAGAMVQIFDLNKPGQAFKTFDSPLKAQSRSLALFIDNTGFALGSVAGRVAIHHIRDEDRMKNFTFKCHRDANKNAVYAVNAIVFHPTYGTFATAGSDGTYSFWDKDSKQRLSKPPRALPQPITCCDFNMNGTIFAYAQSYDWGQGCDNYDVNQKPVIYLHPTTDAEVKPRPAT